ncbi:prepilin peptidase [Ensifer adhaerens]|uniref:prepilin peptidase n=1 Tax=Rhizobium sp. 11_C7_N12_5 TaxID=3240770 RepID=UPI0013AF7752
MSIPAVQCFALVVLLALCSSVSITDWRRMIIPDKQNLLLAISGLIVSSLLPFPGMLDASAGLLAGGLISWTIRSLHREVRKVEGLGLGDVKFIAAAGSWVGGLGLAPMLLFASLTALAYAGLSRGRNISAVQNPHLPFGPFLCVGLVVVAGSQIISGQSIYALLD